MTSIEIKTKHYCASEIGAAESGCLKVSNTYSATIATASKRPPSSITALTESERRILDAYLISTSAKPAQLLASVEAAGLSRLVANRAMSTLGQIHRVQ